ncbi:hypothetical protein H696_05661 [Fonticula alba]|uniref:Cytochrome c oxidase assembly factor 6 n=1 Tax=Fonticula alba TaxID=691883 RepID=A0A058Z1D8_FONAL|nr:hypothetical protein H696_05661 [Fonticula alba]KCV67936.1 hypothetical protein H696_05661 [Fonticula alba]|eukprot:XP_009497756.1 hypothetical protein H696_05661 [Fonticula alba]
MTDQAQNPPPAAAAPAAAHPPAMRREARLACWAARDAFFACGTANQTHVYRVGTTIDAPGMTEKDIAAVPCGPELVEFRKLCPAVWIDHFESRRKAAEYQKYLEEHPPQSRIEEQLERMEQQKRARQQQQQQQPSQ